MLQAAPALLHQCCAFLAPIEDIWCKEFSAVAARGLERWREAGREWDLDLAIRPNPRPVERSLGPDSGLVDLFLCPAQSAGLDL